MKENCGERHQTNSNGADVDRCGSRYATRAARLYGEFIDGRYKL